MPDTETMPEKPEPGDPAIPPNLEPGHPAREGPGEIDSPGRTIDGLALLPEKAILDEAGLAHVLHVNPRTVQRMVKRGQLPVPFILGNRSSWIVGRVLKHIENLAEQKEREAQRRAEKVRQLCP